MELVMERVTRTRQPFRVRRNIPLVRFAPIPYPPFRVQMLSIVPNAAALDRCLALIPLGLTRYGQILPLTRLLLRIRINTILPQHSLEEVGESATPVSVAAGEVEGF